MGWLLVLAACFLWAVDTLIRYPLLESGIDPITIVFFEHLFLSIFFVPSLLKKISNLGQIPLGHIFSFLVVGGFGSALGTLAFTKAFTLINPSLVILLQKLQPLVAIFLARVLLKETLKREFFFFAGLCLIGSFLISFEDLFVNERPLLGGSLEGYGYALLAVISWGAATVFGKKLTLAGFKQKEIMGGRFVLGLLCVLPLVFTNLEIGHLVLDPEQYLKIFIMIFLSGILALLFYYTGLKKLSAHNCTLAELFFPFCAVIVNWLILGVELSFIQLIGGGLLAISSVIIQVRKL